MEQTYTEERVAWLVERPEWKVGNFVWFFCGGLVIMLTWYMIGAFFYITWIGRPLAKYCFLIARYARRPFGRVVECNGDYNFLANIAWMVFIGMFWMLLYIAIGGFFCCTIIGVPIAKAYFRVAGVAGYPIGMQIEKVRSDF